METYKHVLGATDFSELGSRAITRAIALAASSGAKLTLAHVVPSNEPPHAMLPYYRVHEHLEELEQARLATEKALEERVPPELAARGNVHIEVRAGDPAETLIAIIRDAGVDLAVLATNGRHGVRRLLLGSVTERVVRESPALHADVLVVS